MTEKIKRMALLLSGGALKKYHILCKKCKNFLSPYFNYKEREKGIGATALALISAGIIIVGFFVLKTALGQAALNFLCALLAWAADLIRAVCSFLCFTAADMFDTSLVWVRKSITHEAVFTDSWTSVRDLSNMIIVLGFIVVGIATAIRIRDYEAKKLLLPLILVAILINFSGLFCGLIIDSANIVSTSLIQQAGGAAGSDPGLIGMTYRNMITSAGDKLLADSPEKDGDENANTKYLLASLTIAFAYFVVAITFFYMAIIFIARYAMLAFLFILSPLAFVCKVFPLQAAQKIWSDWWQNFLKWAFIAVGGSFALWIANKTMGAIAAKSTTINLSELVVVLLFMIIGFRITTRSSAAGASAVMAMVAGGAGYIAGASSVVGKKAADRLGAARAGAWAKDMATNAGERLRILPQGTTSANQQSRLNTQDRQRRVGAMTTEEKVNALEHPRMGHEAALDRASITKDLSTKGQLGLLTPAQQATAVAQARNFGVRERDLVGGMQSVELAAAINQGDPADRAERFKTLAKRGDLDLIDPAHRQDAFTNAVRHGARPEEIEKSDYHFGGQSEARITRIMNANPTINRNPVTGAPMAARPIARADAEEMATQQTLDENWKNMSGRQKAGVEVRHLTDEKGYRRIDQLKPNELTEAFQYADHNRKEAIRNHFRMGGRLYQDMANAHQQYERALTDGDTATATNRLTEFRRLRALYGAANNL